MKNYLALFLVFILACSEKEDASKLLSGDHSNTGFYQKFAPSLEANMQTIACLTH